MVFESNKLPLALNYDSNGKLIGLRQASELQVSSVSAITFSATNLDVATFTVQDLTVTTLNATNLAFSDLVVTGLTSITINATQQIVAPSFSATTFTVDTFSPATLIVTSLSAYDSVSAGSIRSPDISATTFAAASFNPTTLVASYISATNSVSSAQIRSPDISGTTLSVVTFSPQSLIVTSLSAYTNISGANIRSPSANIGTLSALNSGSLTLASNLDGGGNVIGAYFLQTRNIQYQGTPIGDAEINFGANLLLGANSLSGTGVSAGTGKFPSLTGTTLNSTSATLTNVTGTNAAITTVGGTNSNFTNVTGTNLNSTTANLTTITAGSISATTTLSSIQLRSPSISGTSVTGITLNSTDATLTNVTGTTANITTVKGTTLSGTNVTGISLLGTNVTGTTLNSTNATLTNVTGTNATITTIGGTNSNFTNVTGTTVNATLVKSTSVSAINVSSFNVTGQTLNTWQINMAQPTSVGGFTAPYSGLLLLSANTYLGNGIYAPGAPTSIDPFAGKDLIGARFLDCGVIYIGLGYPAGIVWNRRISSNPGSTTGTPTESGALNVTGPPPAGSTYMSVTSITGGGVTSPDTLIFHGGTNEEDYVVSRILYSVTGIAPVLAVDSPTESEVFSTYNQNTLHSTFLAYNDLKYAVTGNLNVVGGIYSNGVSGSQLSGTSGTFTNLYFTNASSNGGFTTVVSGITPTNATHLATKGYVDTVSGTHTHDLTTTSITGILPISKGGTNATAFSDKAVIYYDSGGGGILLDSGSPSNNTVLVGAAGSPPAFSNQFTVTAITATSALFTTLRSTSFSSNGGFTTVVSGITPTDATHLATKGFTDGKYSVTSHGHSLIGSEITSILPVSKGGTNNSIYDYGGLIYYDNDPEDILATISPGAINTILQGTAGIPSWTATPTVTTMKATTFSGTNVTGLTLSFTNASSTGGFKTTVSGLTPTDSTHLATKNYVDYAAVSANQIWDAKGDLVVGTAANTAGRFAVGSNGKTLIASSTETAGMLWGYRPVHVALMHWGGGLTWTNMPAAATIFASYLGQIHWFDATHYTEVRLQVNYLTAGSSGAKIILRYSTSFPAGGGGAGSYSDIGTSEVSCSVSATGMNLVKSSWIPLAAAAKTDIVLCLIGSGGDGVADPVFYDLSAEFR